MEARARLALDHLLLRLRPLNRALRRACRERADATRRLERPEALPLCVTDEQVTALLDDVESLARPDADRLASLTPAETEAERRIAEQAADLRFRLPLVGLTEALDLKPFELEAVLLCAAPEIDVAYERIFAYALDDLNRRLPCVELLASLTAVSTDEKVERSGILGIFGRLRRTGILEPFGESPTHMRQPLRLGRGVLEFLLGGAGDPARLFPDPAEVRLPPSPGGAAKQGERLQRISDALRDGAVDVVGIWGSPHSGTAETAEAVLRAAGRPVRRLVSSVHSNGDGPVVAAWDEQIHAAAALNAVLWIRTDDLPTTSGGLPPDSLAEAVARSAGPAVISGRAPWRPTPILTTRSYAELEIDPPTYAARKLMWTEAMEDLDQALRDDLAARFRLSGGEIRAVARVAKTDAVLSGDGRPAPLEDHLEQACATVTRRRVHHFADVIRPKRGPDDLVLRDELHRQVLEVAGFYRAWPSVAEDWGFGRLVTGAGGIKALFTGDSGTGKTLAAEVIAGTLGVALLKVDLARILSRWVGETEQNLAAAFEEAEESHAVLFFDEADSLFGKRGEVHHGTDRYANLEVSYLLQRMEDYGGLVILCSNLRDNIDPAFTRRFQVTLDFPRPDLPSRRRIWEISLPAEAPRSDDVDFEALADLDMTGGSITASARTAALLAAGDGCQRISMEHLVLAISRQYRREARLLRPSDLGPHGRYLRET